MTTVDISDEALASLTGSQPHDLLVSLLVTMHQRGLAAQLMPADFGPLSPATARLRERIARACGASADEVARWEQGASRPVSTAQGLAWLQAMYDENPDSFPFRRGIPGWSS